MRIFFIGMLGQLSRLPLAALIKAGADVVGLGLPADRIPPFMLSDGEIGDAVTPLPMTLPENQLFSSSPPTSILQLAAGANIPAFGLRKLSHPALHERLNGLAPDLICVSCFPRKIPQSLLEIPRLGALNVHPSLLPQFRGPAPLFWTFRSGVRESGVTIHFMDAGLDTGDIVHQRPYTLPDGISGFAAERNLGRLAGSCLVETVSLAAKQPLPRRSQASGPPPDPWPGPADFALDPAWSARHAFNFMRGTVEWGRPYRLEIELAPKLFSRALRILPPHSNHVAGPGERAIRFADGTLLLKEIVVPLSP